ncbi:MAG: hypothetical protein K5786_04655 [Treponema sp.]|nr:hypothetical protein [Treponema sp.]
MKKILAFIITSFLLCTVMFSKGFFGDRFFEYKISVPFAISNNCFSVDDFMKKEAVIDFKKYVNDLNGENLDFITTVNPDVSINLNLPHFSIGLDAGLDVFSNIAFSDGLLKFMATGMKINDVIDISVSPKIDIFVYSQANVGLKLSNFNLYVRPGVFIPAVSVSGSTGGIKIENTNSGINIITDTVFNTYSTVDLESIMSDPETFDFDYSVLGIDLAFGGDFFLIPSLLKLSADARIPIIPATMNYQIATSFASSTTISLAELDAFEMNIPEAEFQNIGSAAYKINRPLVAMGYIDFYPMRNFLDLRVGGGVGIYHPFMTDDTSEFYFQYYLGLTVNIINMLKFSLSSEYTKQIFVQQAGFVLNLRIIEIDLGLSMQSSSFAKSWLGSGFGGYLVFSMGF